MTLRSNVDAGQSILHRSTQFRWCSRSMWLHAAVINAFIAGVVMISHCALGQGAHGAPAARSGMVTNR
jgi:hypothetical protein